MSVFFVKSGQQTKTTRLLYIRVHSYIWSSVFTLSTNVDFCFVLKTICHGFLVKKVVVWNFIKGDCIKDLPCGCEKLLKTSF